MWPVCSIIGYTLDVSEMYVSGVSEAFNCHIIRKYEQFNYTGFNFCWYIWLMITKICTGKLSVYRLNLNITQEYYI